jgi:hypothetical protein
MNPSIKAVPWLKPADPRWLLGLISALGAPAAVLIDAASDLTSALLRLRMPTVEPPRRPVSLRGIRAEATEGMRWIYSHPTLRPLALNTHGWFLCNAAAGVVLAPFALRTLGLSAFGLGVAMAVGRVGGLIGSLAATRLGAGLGAGRVVIAARAGTAAAVGTGGAENANEMGYWQAVTPDALQARTNATRRSINRAMIVLGAPAGGFLADALGYRAMLYTAAAGFFIVSATLAASRFRTTRIDDVTARQNDLRTLRFRPPWWAVGIDCGEAGEGEVGAAVPLQCLLDGAGLLLARCCPVVL